MTAAAMQPPPTIPPRPTRSQDQEKLAAPKIPPRPAGKRSDRSISPNPDRFAPSPLHGGIPPKNSTTARYSPGNALSVDDPVERSGSVPMPSVGEEGVEYSAVAKELSREEEQEKLRSSSPEQTRTVADDLQLHAPKPSLPAHSAKQRVQAVTRTDSDKAASYGIGRPTDERAASRDGIKRSSASFSTTSESQPVEDEQGTPGIGQRVPMNPNLGDVQAPSPGPSSEEFKRHHHRKNSSRGGPPGSYGLHGHGVAPQDKLDKEYYQKHPELLHKEYYQPIHDRQNDYAMSSSDLNKLVRDTASRGAGLGTSSEYCATPTDEVAFQAHEEYSRSRPASVTPPKGDNQHFQAEVTSPEGEQTFHVDDPKHPEYRSYGDGENVHGEEADYKAPILASDEVGKDSNAYLQLLPAVHPPAERRGSAYEMDDTPSRPTSRPTSLYRNNSSQQEFEPTPLDDVKEYEPLFPEETKTEKQKAEHADENKARHHFPSKDVWEDAPSSVHYTAEVSTPELPEHNRRKSSNSREDRPETPAHAFARHQEELAEREVSGHTESYVPRSGEKPTWAGHQPHLKPERPASGQRFPSRDVWEDTPESLLHQTIVSTPQTEEDKSEELKPEIPVRPTKKSPESSERPAIPERPKSRPTPSNEAQSSKPPVPPRPAKSISSDSKDEEASKSKAPVTGRPVGGKIAALQAGFMSDLNKRLKLGPQAPKKEESKPEEAPAEDKAPAPLSDARKGRARGPQRRAPAKAATPAAAPAEAAKPSIPTLSVSVTSSWSIHPDSGELDVNTWKDEPAISEQPVEKSSEPASGSETVDPIEADLQPAQPKANSDQQDPFDEPPKQAVVEPSEQKAAAIEEPLEEVSSDPAEQPKTSERAEVSDEPVKEEKTLASNMAGESVLEATVEKKDGGNDVEPVDVDDKPKV